MLSLGSGFNYYFCAKPVTLRYRHKGLRHYIKSQLHRDPTNGDPHFMGMKSDEKTISALSAQAHNAEADKRTLQKKLAASERRVQALEKRLTEQQAASDEKVRELTDKLSREMAKVSDMMEQLVDFMMGKGSVTLSDTLRDSVVSGVREKVRKEFQGILEEKDAEIAALKALQNHDNVGCANSP